jgi:uncharacterized protein Yka (UPF0111/DUF47 family)
VARISLVPQNKQFFRLLEHASDNAVGISRQLVQLLDAFPSNGTNLREIKELEHEGDRLTREVVDLLNRTFVTPFDRDDIYLLAGAIDDVCDHVDEAAGNIVGYGVEQIKPKAKEQAQVILRSAEKLHEAVSRLEGFKDSSSQLHALRDHPLEGHPRTARGSRRRVRERRRRPRGNFGQEPLGPVPLPAIRDGRTGHS